MGETNNDRQTVQPINRLTRRAFIKASALAAGSVVALVFGLKNRNDQTPKQILAVTDTHDENDPMLFTEQQIQQYNEISQVYERNGLTYHHSMPDLYDNSLKTGDQRIDKNQVSVTMNQGDFDTYGLTVLQIGYLLFGDKGPQYLFDLTKQSDTGAGYWGGVDPNVSGISYGLSSRQFGPNIRSMVALHEYTHLLDGKAGLFTLDEKLRLEKLKADILFKFGSIGILDAYNFWYTNISNVPIDEHNNYYWQIGEYVSQYHSNALASGYESSDTIRQWISDLGGLQNDNQKQLIGAKIMRQKALHPEWQLSLGLNGIYSDKMYGAMIEVFAEAVSNIVTKYGTKYATDSELEPLAGEYLTISRYGLNANQQVKVPEFRQQILELTFASPAIPYVLVPPA